MLRKIYPLVSSEHLLYIITQNWPHSIILHRLGSKIP
jgi:hypothetical protein